MRYVATAAIIFWGFLASGLAAFNVEEVVAFDVPNPVQKLSILSTADTQLFAPLIYAFQTENPNISVTYTLTGSSDIMTALLDEGRVFDLVISSAMDLQTKLANDGFATQYQSDATDVVPTWARWRNSVFAFTQEPATIVLSRAAFAAGGTPKTRPELIEMMRADPDKFRGKVGTYDIRKSGFGYLIATQDSRTSDTYWRFTEVMGALDPKLYCCSSDMINDIVSGDIIVAYNVLGSYVRAQDRVSDQVIVIEPEDYTTVMLRSALLMRGAPNGSGGQRFLDFLLATAWEREDDSAFLFPNKPEEEVGRTTRLRPIRLGPGLLVHLDRFKRDRFIREWEASILQ